MGETLVFTAPRTIQAEAYDEKPLQPDEVRLATLYSGISAGTQLTAYRGTNPMVSKRRNPESNLFEARTDHAPLYPIKGCWAYEEVGKVVEAGSGVTTIRIGDIVYGAWGHKSTHVTNEAYAREHRLPEGLDPVAGIYSQMGAIALNAVLDANIHVGEMVAVFGQGVPGQIAAQLARLNGASVIVVDVDDYRLDVARKLGADIVLNSGSCDAAKEIKKLTGNRGADVAIDFSGFYPALHEAIRSCAYNGRVVSAGFYQGEGAGLYLGEEFHHNRIQVICSQIGGIAPELSHRWDRLRLEKTVFRLVQEGKLRLQELITHVVPFRDGKRAYQMLDQRTEPGLQVVLAFDQAT
ncbi:zinc-binding alcohol dehydrogenase [Paenibacillus sp. 32O-W]|uniref:zinc-binding dehydrogenase n=1 Tax=Paenibacillus sp. 32O-W TaxID=1695218 RepID=UPI00071F3C11|nr:zinc-binding dehydrogenase [Paenibacillus sp. 32O-W]ALS27871.1 zinc-binding alcohol dehydrogenase [Paenibacillus sp. 32O-W]